MTEARTRKLNKAKGVYYVLVLREDGDDKWHQEFGDYYKPTVIEEMNAYTAHDFLKKNAKVIETGDTQEAINQAIAELNK